MGGISSLTFSSTCQTHFEKQRVEHLATMAGLGPSQFNRLFCQAYGTSPIDWLRHERINQAKRRLAETTDPIERIATQVGYQDLFFFSKDFKRMTGLNPPRPPPARKLTKH